MYRGYMTKNNFTYSLVCDKDNKFVFNKLERDEPILSASEFGCRDIFSFPENILSIVVISEPLTYFKLHMIKIIAYLLV